MKRGFHNYCNERQFQTWTWRPRTNKSRRLPSVTLNWLILSMVKIMVYIPTEQEILYRGSRFFPVNVVRLTFDWDACCLTLEYKVFLIHGASRGWRVANLPSILITNGHHTNFSTRVRWKQSTNAFPNAQNPFPHVFLNLCKG